MKRLYSLLLTICLTTAAFAQWPANYGGVMLQSFYWNSFDDTKWSKLTDQVDEISPFIDVLWIPNSAYCSSGESMGYDPMYWFRQRSTFGQERDLRLMVKAYKEKGVSVIEDVVLNHKKGVTGWVDFANEEWTHDGVTEKIEWSLADICQNDDGGYTKNQGYKVTGANDTGDDFSGFRDLDHTSANVQKNCITYLKYLMQDIGYAGFRLDMVKGYSAEFTKLYNEAVKPTFCVGEYWDGKDAITNWINATGKTAAAFDFPLKYNIKKAFGDGYWGALNDACLANDSYWSQYSVTFIDNHDTYRDEDGNRLRGKVLAANAYLLGMPGTPCIFLRHWQRYPIAIGNMILARKAAGVTNQSQILQGDVTEGGYILRTKGSKGDVLVLCGSATTDTNGFKLIQEGEGFKFYVSSSVNVEGLRTGVDSNGEDEVKAESITVNVKADKAPYLYAWNAGGELNGKWPGTLMTETTTIGDEKFYTKTFPTAPINVIFNDGGDPAQQTADIAGLAQDSYFTYDGAKGYENITSRYAEVKKEPVPACVTHKDGKLYAYFRGNLDFDVVYCYAWNKDTEKKYTKDWPGDLMQVVGKDDQGRKVYFWDGGDLGEDLPTNIIFNNQGAPQTADLQFVNNGYYNINGAQADIVAGISPVLMSTVKNGTVYDLQGRRVQNPTKGLYIQDGKKMIVR